MKVETALTRLRDSGYRETAARRAVLRVLAEAGGHMTSSDVIEAIGELDEAISRASVFRTLDLLSSLSIIRPTYIEARTPLYVLMSPSGHHSHIICTQCGKIIELDECYVHALEETLAEEHDIKLSGHLVEFYGACRSCQPVA